MAGVISARVLIRLAIRSLFAAPDDGRYRIQRVIARRKIFDVAVIAGEYNGSADSNQYDPITP